MEQKKFRRIGILTSGGDAPGMNACYRAAARSIIANGAEAMGIRMGYKGLIENDMKLLNLRDVSNIINLGGTKLYSDRCLEFKTEAGMKIAIDNCRKNKIDGIITIGGDGTFRGARDLSERGVPCIGIPGTIDNDITSTDNSIGFDTALNTVTGLVDKLRDTCESHARCNVVEAMGRGSGYLALYAGIAVGAIYIIINEIQFDKEKLFAKMKTAKDAHKRNYIVMVSENMGSGFSESLVKEIEEKVGIETKFLRPAHAQRGGNPTFRDRMLATLMGKKAVDLLYEGKSNLVICERHSDIVSMDIGFALDADRYYKGKMTAEDIAKIPGEDFAKMRELAKERSDHFKMIYDINDIVSI